MHTPSHADASPSITIPIYISRRRLAELTGLSETTIWRCIRRGDLPAPLRLSPGRVAWPESVIATWLAAREAGR